MLSELPKRTILVITGAGASTSLSSSETPLPLMPAWASSLIEDVGAHYAAILGLENNMDGALFEERLGDYLEFCRALPATQKFGLLGAVPAGPGEVVDFEEWYRRADRVSLGLTRAIWKNLFKNFGRARIDTEAAHASYSALHAQLRKPDGAGAESYIIHATTNFDSAIEVAIVRESEKNPYVSVLDGFAQQIDTELWSPNLYSAGRRDSTGQIPVLHLHGAVGWYFDEAENIRRRPSDEPLDERYRPALLLPEAHKDPENFPMPIREVWDQFLLLLQEATHVLFLGHSLHDAHIVKAVVDAGKPVAAVALTVPDDAGRYTLDGSSTDQLSNLIDGLIVIPGKFGQRAAWPDLDPESILNWLRPRVP